MLFLTEISVKAIPLIYFYTWSIELGSVKLNKGNHFPEEGVLSLSIPDPSRKRCTLHYLQEEVCFITSEGRKDFSLPSDKLSQYENTTQPMKNLHHQELSFSSDGLPFKVPPPNFLLLKGFMCRVNLFSLPFHSTGTVSCRLLSM